MFLDEFFRIWMKVSVALTGCPFKSCWSQKIQSSQRFVCHGSGADVTIERFQVGNSAGSELVVLRARSCAMWTTTGGMACLGDGTSPSWNPCWLKDPSCLKGSSFCTPEDDRRCGNASVVQGCLEVGQTGTWNCRMNWHRADSE